MGTFIGVSNQVLRLQHLPAGKFSTHGEKSM
jgi:hypothetical protein